jgi:hypothetical protein
MLIFSEKTYNFGKRLVQVILPAFSALYFALASTWDLPNADKVIATNAAITTFLGICLGISSNTFNKMNMSAGKIVVVNDEEGKKTYSLELDGDPRQMELKDTVTFKVEKT